VYNPKGNYTPKVITKAETEKQKIKNLISDIFMFKCLEEKDLSIIIDAMEAKNFQPGDTVIQEGDDGNELFIVSSGHLKCTKVINEENKELRDYDEGDVFGELALMYNTPRAATIKALDKSFLYSLDRECFNHIVKEATI
jgi:cAMP-dependent protein kinase regulator